MGRCRHPLPWSAAATLAACFAASAVGQTPTLRVQWHFAAGCAERGPAAVRTLLRELLPAEPGWPAALQPEQSLVVTWQDQRWHFAASNTAPPGAALFAVALWPTAGGPPAVGSCDTNGIEDWFVPTDWSSSAPESRWLAQFAPADGGGPRTYHVATLIAPQLEPSLDGSPTRKLLELAAECGELCVVAWQSNLGLRVRGRSEGGLSVPAFLLWRLGANPPDAATDLRLHALAACDSERSAAARLGSRAASFGATLWQALLYADDATRLAAIDSLVRRGEAAALPAVVAAADPRLPLSLQATADAVRELWSTLPTRDQPGLLRALAQSAAPGLRSLAVELAAAPGSRFARQGVDPGARARWLLALGCLAAGVYGLWLRERLARHGAPRRRRRTAYLPPSLG
jgi:hypothetical protein